MTWHLVEGLDGRTERRKMKPYHCWKTYQYCFYWKGQFWRHSLTVVIGCTKWYIIVINLVQVQGLKVLLAGCIQYSLELSLVFLLGGWIFLQPIRRFQQVVLLWECKCLLTKHTGYLVWVWCGFNNICEFLCEHDFLLLWMTNWGHWWTRCCGCQKRCLVFVVLSSHFKVRQAE